MKNQIPSNDPRRMMVKMNFIICILLFLFPLAPVLLGWDLMVAAIMLLPASVWLAISVKMWRDLHRDK